MSLAGFACRAVLVESMLRGLRRNPVDDAHVQLGRGRMVQGRKHAPRRTPRLNALRQGQPLRGRAPHVLSIEQKLGHVF